VAPTFVRAGPVVRTLADPDFDGALVGRIPLGRMTATQ
jgi:hypothetical protein